MLGNQLHHGVQVSEGVLPTRRERVLIVLVHIVPNFNYTHQMT